MKFLTRKFGPLPVWAYALGTLGLVLYARYRARQGAGGASTDTAGPYGQIPIAMGDMSVLPPQGPGDGFSLPPAPPPTSATATTNGTNSYPTNVDAGSGSSAPSSGGTISAGFSPWQSTIITNSLGSSSGTGPGGQRKVIL